MKGIWYGMRLRCGDPENLSYANYGGRGIKVCERWHDFATFYEDMGDRPSADYSIERIDVNGDYEPKNCKWLLKKDQGRNKRETLFVEYGGIRRKFAELCDENGWDYRLVLKRYRRGWPLEIASTVPRGGKRP